MSAKTGQKSNLWQSVRSAVNVWWNEDVYWPLTRYKKSPWEFFTRHNQPGQLLDKLANRVEYSVKDYLKHFDPTTDKELQIQSPTRKILDPPTKPRQRV